MSNEKMRKDFEKWYAIHTAGWPPGIANSECCKDVMWQPWQASRAAVVVDFSPCNVQHASYNDVDCYAIDDVKVIMKRNGLGMKP